MRTISLKRINAFKESLIAEEKAQATINKYTKDVMYFNKWLLDKKLDKNNVLKYKDYLIKKYSVSSVNVILSSLNNFFDYMEWYDLKVKNIKIQKRIFSLKENELTKSEYERLLIEANKKKNKQLYLLIQTICSTGIRVSEISYITIDVVNTGIAYIDCKGKKRQVFLPQRLCQMLKEYVEIKKIKSGHIFITKNGKPLDRSNIWSSMKRLCKNAKVLENKVYPHNLRHLFARTYYSFQKDIVSLAAPILGRPILSTNKNSITWQKVVGASYYKIFNSVNDELIGETSDLSYKFENSDNQNLRVYIIAYYKNNELMDKKSSKSNVAKVNPDILIVDVKEIDSSVSEYVLEEYVKKVTFIGSSSCSFGINITDRNTKLDITFDNLQMQTNDGSCLLAKNNNSEINLTIIGSCKLRSMNSNAIKVPKLNLLGNSDSSLHVVGGNGANGTNGLNGNAGSEDGYSGTNGTNGKNGNDGYSAILASQLTVSNIKLTAIGGNGGKGGDGGNGGNGGVGKTKVNIFTGGKDGDKNYGGKGGSGGNGGNGGKGAYGINTSCNIKEIGSASVNIFSANYGAGGNGGNGGNGGKGGNYYNSLGSVWRCSGGNGGNGGNGGDGIIGGNAGTGGKYGNPGDGEPVNGIGVGINYGAVFSDNIQPSRSSNGTKGKSLK